MSWQKQTYCWLSSARYTRPLDLTTSKKWEAMARGLGVDMRVIGFATGLRPRVFNEHARFYLLPQPGSSALRYLIMFTLATMLAIWLVLRHNVRVFVAQSPYEGAIGAWVKKIMGVFGKDVRLIVESHNDFEQVLFLQRNIPFQNVYRSLMQKSANYAFKHADALRSISEATHAQLQQYAPSPYTPIVRFMTWTDLDAFANATRTKSLSETKDILYAGVLVPGKGVHFLIDAFARLDDKESKLYLVGDAPNHQYLQDLKNQVAKLNLGGRIHFVGKVNQPDLARYMGAVRVMVLPSLSEGLGRVIVEAMICGTPVIASEVGGIPELITSGENGILVPPGDTDTLYAALDEILRNPFIEDMGKNAKAFASSYFSTNSYVAGYRQLFEQLDFRPDGTASKR